MKPNGEETSKGLIPPITRCEEDVYRKVRARYTEFQGNKYSLSDKEIIEKQEEEIEYYRHKIQLLEKAHTEVAEDEPIGIMKTTTMYADGRPRKIITEYKYKDETEDIL